VAGIALSSSLSYGVVLLYFIRRFAQDEPAFEPRAIARTVGRATLAAAPGAIAIGAIAWSGVLPPNPAIGLVALVAFGLAGIAIYAVLARSLGLVEIRTLLGVVQARFGLRGLAS